MSQNTKNHIRPIVSLTIAWVIAAAVVNPLGNFPLNDDFSFARSVFNLSELGVLEFDKWLDMTIITQVLWGAGVSEIFGFSFTALRLSVLFLSLLSAIGIYLISSDLGASKNISALAALSVGFSPIFFSLSYTFMSDVPFFTCCVWSIFFYNRAFSSGKISWIVWGSLLALAATFIRQLGFMLSVAFAFTWVFKTYFGKYFHNDWSPSSPQSDFSGKKWHLKNLLIAVAPLAVTTALYLWYMDWFKTSQGLPESFGTFPKLFKRLGKDGFLWDCFWRIGMLAAYLGLALLPFTLAIRQMNFWKKNWWRERRFSNAHRIVFFALLILIGASLVPNWGKMIWGNICYNFGLGPQTLKDGQFFMNTPMKLPERGIQIVRLVYTIGAIFLIIRILPSFFVKLRREHPHFLPAVFAFANIILYGGFLMLDLKFFDRYFFQLLPFLVVILAPATAKQSRAWKPASIAALILIAVFSIVATHDYLAWNRARWQALDHLTKEMKITPDRIDGGFEFNGWHREPDAERTYGGGRSWWWVTSDKYAVTFGPMDGYSVVKEYPYFRFLPWGESRMYIIRKE